VLFNSIDYLWYCADLIVFYEVFGVSDVMLDVVAVRYRLE